MSITIKRKGRIEKSSLGNTKYYFYADHTKGTEQCIGYYHVALLDSGELVCTIDGMELSDKERAVLENLITEKYNNVELGQQFNCSRQRMHQVEIKLRKKLKAVLVM